MEKAYFKRSESVNINLKADTLHIDLKKCIGLDAITVDVETSVIFAQRPLVAIRSTGIVDNTRMSVSTLAKNLGLKPKDEKLWYKIKKWLV